MSPAERVYQNLIVDDNAADVSLLEMGFQECPGVGVHLETHRLTQPRDIVSYLYGVLPYGGAVRPDLIVLDYHMATDGALVCR